MKKLLTLVIIVFTIFSCNKKMSPAKPVTVLAPVMSAPLVVTDSAAINKLATMNASTLAASQKVYVAKCGKCHELKNPADYTQEKWVDLVNWMAPRAKANDIEKGQILAYVQHNAKDAVSN